MPTQRPLTVDELIRHLQQMAKLYGDGRPVRLDFEGANIPVRKVSVLSGIVFISGWRSASDEEK